MHILSSASAITDAVNGIPVDITSAVVAGVGIAAVGFAGRAVWLAVKSLSTESINAEVVRQSAYSRAYDLGYDKQSAERFADETTDYFKHSGGLTREEVMQSVNTINSLRAWATTTSHLNGASAMERQGDFNRMRDEGFSATVSADIVDGNARYGHSSYGFAYAQYPGGKKVWSHDRVSLDEARENRAQWKLAQKTV